MAICLMLASCATKAQVRHKAMDSAFDGGDFIAMADSLKRNSKKLYGENGAFLFHMDLGVLYHYSGQYSESGKHFQQAAEIYHDLFTRSVSNEAAALLTNDNARPYRSKPYELTTLHQFAALNFMAAGDFDGALVESRKAQLLFNEWERLGAKDGKYHTDGMFHLMSSLAYERTDEPDNSLISLYKSVDAYKKGPVALPPEVEGFAYDRLMAGDRENDVTALGISSKGGANKWDAQQGQAEIVVVAYAGRGPNLVEENWYGTYIQGGRLQIHTRPKEGVRLTLEIPAPPLPAGKGGPGQKVDVKISLPKLRNDVSRTSHFTGYLEDSDDTVESVVVNDFEKQAKKALDDAWGDIVARTVVRMIVRTLAANETKNRTQTSSPLLNVLTSVATDIATDQMERADTRMCFLLPQRIHVMRFPVEPGTHSVTLNAHDRSGRIMEHKTFDNIEVKRGEKKVLLHHSFR